MALATVTGDVVSVRAKRMSGSMLMFEIVDEFGDEYVGGGRVADAPLTMAELVEFIDGAEIVDHDGACGGLVFSLLEDWYSYNPDDLESLTGAVTVSSAFYSELQRYYGGRVATWIEERPVDTRGTYKES